MFQDPLIPNAVHLLPIFKTVSELKGPLHCTVLESPAANVTVRSHDNIQIELTAPLEKVEVTVLLGGEAQSWTLQSDQNISAFHLAAITDALKQHALENGYEVNLKAKVDDGMPLYSAGVGGSAPKGKALPECYVLAEAWVSEFTKRSRTRRGLDIENAATEQLYAKRDERRKAEEERQRLEQKADEVILQN